MLDRAKVLHVGRKRAVTVDVPIKFAFVEDELLVGLQSAQLMNRERNRRGSKGPFCFEPLSLLARLGGATTFFIQLESRRIDIAGITVHPYEQ